MRFNARKSVSRVDRKRQEVLLSFIMIPPYRSESWRLGTAQPGARKQPDFGILKDDGDRV